MYRKAENKPHAVVNRENESATRRRVGTDGTLSFPCIFLQLNRQTNRRSRANCFEANGRPADKRVLEAREIKVELARDIHCVALIYEVGNGRGRRQRRRPIPLSTARRAGREKRRWTGEPEKWGGWTLGRTLGSTSCPNRSNDTRSTLLFYSKCRALVTFWVPIVARFQADRLLRSDDIRDWSQPNTAPSSF